MPYRVLADGVLVFHLLFIVFAVAGGAAGYPGGFIEHYLLPLLYPAELTRTVQYVLGAGLVAFNALVYFFVWRRHRGA